MSDRPVPSADDDDDNLDYLDAGLPPEERTSTKSPPAGRTGVARATNNEPPASTVTRPDFADPPPAPPSGGAGEARATPQRDSSWIWPIINLVGLIAVVAMNYSANYFEFNGLSTGDVANRDPVPFQPAGWVFSIWGIIYLLLGVFVVYGLLPAGRHNPRLQRISPLFLVTNLANASWIVLWHWEQVGASLGVIVLLLVALVGIYLGVRVQGNPFRREHRQPVPKPTLVERIALRLPFSIYLGWVSVATLSNAMVWLDRSGRDLVFSLNWWTVIFMILATLVAVVFMVTSHDGIVALVIAVAFAGIAQQNWGETTALSVTAMVFAVVAAMIAGAATLMAFDRDTHRSITSIASSWRG